ncbi:4-(cytidine 5'-diphospho)-2-C-methyl-D-erythritol kinase, partial [Sphingomonas sp.]|uniref:4-(cytidine 5'-diphospho)-2-C-methyl-D-erythritol kinase n=1 Tax=Sphingomonas sp. TaxID=28214 RepID=UPI002B77290F
MIEESAPAKLNLALHVRARREDGYHELETLFAFVADGDTIRLNPDGPAGLTITGPFAQGLAGEGDNLVLRAERLFAERVSPMPLAAIELVKRLPVASGIGGGSADAAATLRALARTHGVALDDARLFDCAAALGSDVPACLLGRAAIGRGRGERLEPLPGLP